MKNYFVYREKFTFHENSHLVRKEEDIVHEKTTLSVKKSKFSMKNYFVYKEKFIVHEKSYLVCKKDGSKAIFLDRIV